LGIEQPCSQFEKLGAFLPPARAATLRCEMTAACSYMQLYFIMYLLFCGVLAEWL
jgi:hypothetical protein